MISNVLFRDLGDAGARRLAASPHLGKLVWLGLGFNDSGMDGL
jgi:hypothetical protein